MKLHVNKCFTRWHLYFRLFTRNKLNLIDDLHANQKLLYDLECKASSLTHI